MIELLQSRDTKQWGRKDWNHHGKSHLSPKIFCGCGFLYFLLQIISSLNVMCLMIVNTNLSMMVTIPQTDKCFVLYTKYYFKWMWICIDLMKCNSATEGVSVWIFRWGFPHDCTITWRLLVSFMKHSSTRASISKLFLTMSSSSSLSSSYSPGAASLCSRVLRAVKECSRCRSSGSWEGCTLEYKFSGKSKICNVKNVKF